MSEPPATPATPREAPGGSEAVVRDIGRLLQRMAERTRDEEGYVPHPIAVAVAEAVRGGNLTDGDGTFGAEERGYRVHMSKAHGHFALLDVANRATGRLLPPPVVLRVLRAHEALSAHPGEALPAALAEATLAGLLGLDDAASARLLLRKAGLAGAEVPKRALLERVEALPP